MRYAICAAMALICITLPAQTSPATPQFEVASVRPAAQDDGAGGPVGQVLREFGRNNRRPGEIPMESPDLVRLDNWTLLDLIAVAYSVRANQVSGPAWLSDQNFVIEAKVPVGTAKEKLNPMLQSLLEDRFGLKVHLATQTGQGFALMIEKGGPKLTTAVPRPAPAQALTDEEKKEQSAQFEQEFQAGMGAKMKQMQEREAEVGPFSARSWDSITMEDLATQLVRFARAPVIDETGLNGEYKVKIETWQNADVPGGTIFDAVERLGLKLEPRKLTVETVMVDKVSKTPTEN